MDEGEESSARDTYYYCEGKVSKEPWWKRRVKDSIAELWRHVNILEKTKQGKLKRKGILKGRKNRLTKQEN